MTRVLPTCIRYTSGTFKCIYDGTSGYYFKQQVKQNLEYMQACGHVGPSLNMPCLHIKTNKGLRPIHIPALLPIHTHIRALCYTAHMLHTSWGHHRSKIAHHAYELTPEIFKGHISGIRCTYRDITSIKNALASWASRGDYHVKTLGKKFKGATLKSTRQIKINVLKHFKSQYQSQKNPKYDIFACLMMMSQHCYSQPFFYKKKFFSKMGYARAGFKNGYDVANALKPKRGFEILKSRPAQRDSQTCIENHNHEIYNINHAKITMLRNMGEKNVFPKSFSMAAAKPPSFGEAGCKTSTLFMHLCMYSLACKNAMLGTYTFSTVNDTKPRYVINASQKTFFDLQGVKHVPDVKSLVAVAGQHLPKAAYLVRSNPSEKQKLSGFPKDSSKDSPKQSPKEKQNLKGALFKQAVTCSMAYASFGSCRSFNRNVILNLFLMFPGYIIRGKEQKLQNQNFNMEPIKGKAKSNNAKNSYKTRLTCVTKHRGYEPSLENRIKTCFVFHFQYLSIDSKTLRPTLSVRM